MAKSGHVMSYLRQGYGCMTHTGTGDKYLRWERGVTVDKYQAKAGTGKKKSSEMINWTLPRSLSAKSSKSVLFQLKKD